MSTPAELLQCAIEAARLGGALLKQKFDGPLTVETKGGASNNFVTDADRASEAAVFGLIRQRYPSHALLGEESGVAGPTNASYRWIVDPLDGTSNYAHRVPHFCVSIGVEGPDEKGEPVLYAGVVFDPMRDELYAAARGQGASLNGKRIAVSQAKTVHDALLCTGFPYDTREKPAKPVGLLDHFVRRAAGMRRFGAAALDFAYIAAGRYDGFFECGLQPWDTAAGALLVLEAGGVVTGLDGTPYRPEQPDLLAAGPGLMPELIAETAKALNLR